MSKEINTPQNNSEEIDLGQLFKLIGNMFQRFFSFIGNILNKLFLAFVWFVFFVKKHSIILLISGVLGFAYGFFKEKTSDPVFKSSILIKQNYNAGETLYNSINYYNGLLYQNDYMALAEELSIDSSDVASIVDFEIEALITENDRLVQFDRYSKKLDSALVSTIDYNDYVQNAKEHIYEMQQIVINSKTNGNFNKVFNAIVKRLNSITYFKREQEKDIRQLENRKLAIERALSESDTLKIVYKKVLENNLEQKNGSQTSITIEGSDDKSLTKEFDLYKSDIELRRELVSIEREKEDKQFIIETISNTPSKGFIDYSIEISGKSINLKVFYAISIILIVLIILLMLRFIKFIERYKS